MDFTQAQFEGGTPAAAQCAACKLNLTGQYWTAGPLTVCAGCAEQVKAGPPPGGGFVRVFKAVLFGCGAGLLGATGYGLIIHYAKVELALVTILIGWMVGRSVRVGSEHRGGRGYQLLGALLTYGWCMMAYVPDIVEGLANAKDPLPTFAAVIIAPFIALAVPFTGAMGVLGTLILAFGVWRGWREPVRVEIPVAGPFELGTAPPPEPAAAPAQ
jgi:hypothetical protein